MAANPQHRRRSRRWYFRTVPHVVIALAIITLGGVGWYSLDHPLNATAAAVHPPSSLPTSFGVTAISGFRFDPTTTEVANNTTITLHFVNSDSVSHTFALSTLQGVAIPTSASISTTGWMFAGVFHPWLTMNVSGTPTADIQLGPLGMATATFEAPATGWYEYICTEPGHFYPDNMFSAVGFGVPAPSNLTGGSGISQVGWPVYVIAGTIVGLVVLALVLGFAYGQRHGSKYEMPPERLGYPEPPANPPALPSAPASPPSGPPDSPKPPAP